MKVLSQIENPLVAEIGEVLTEKTRSDARPSRSYFSVALADQVDVLGKPARVLVMQGHHLSQGVEKTRWEGGNPNILRNLVGKPLQGHKVFQVETPDYTIKDPRTGVEKTVNKRSFVVRPGQSLENVYNAWLNSLPTAQGGQDTPVAAENQAGLDGPVVEDEIPVV